MNPGYASEGSIPSEESYSSDEVEEEAKQGSPEPMLEDGFELDSFIDPNPTYILPFFLRDKQGPAVRDYQSILDISAAARDADKKNKGHE